MVWIKHAKTKFPRRKKKLYCGGQLFLGGFQNTLNQIIFWYNVLLLVQCNLQRHQFLHQEDSQYIWNVYAGQLIQTFWPPKVTVRIHSVAARSSRTRCWEVLFLEVPLLVLQDDHFPLCLHVAFSLLRIPCCLSCFYRDTSHVGLVLH